MLRGLVIDMNHIMSAILSSKGASSKLIDWIKGTGDSQKSLL